MKLLLHSLFLSIVATTCPAAELKPLMAVPDEVALENDFSNADQLTKAHWAPRQGTQWSIKEGQLIGIPSTAEYQAKKPDHKGLEPRISSPITPAEVIAQFSIRFAEGEETAIAPFVEFGHHVARVKFSATSVYLLGEHDSVKFAEATDFRYEPGRWYHCLAELKGDEFVIQFADGPTLYAKHPSYALPPPSGAPGMGVTGPRGGRVEIDNVTFWTVRDTVQESWAATRASFPSFEPVRVKPKK